MGIVKSVIVGVAVVLISRTIIQKMKPETTALLPEDAGEILESSV